MRWFLFALPLLVSCGSGDCNVAQPESKNQAFMWGGDLEELCQDELSEKFRGYVKGTVDSLTAVNALNEKCADDLSDADITEIVCEHYKADVLQVGRLKTLSYIVYESLTLRAECSME